MWSFVKEIVLGGLLLALISCSSPVVTSSPTPPPEVTSLAIPSPTPVPMENAPSTSKPTTVPMEAAPTESATIEPIPAAPQVIEHTVLPGETMLNLALRYGVPMAAIQLQNQLGASTALQAGQVLDIPPAAEWEGASLFWVVYLVEEGATLSGIAALYALDLATLRAVNGLTRENSDLLRVGQPLILPLDAPADAVRAPDPTPTPVPPTPTPEMTKSPQPTREAQDSPSPTPPAEPRSTAADLPPTDIAGWPGEAFRLINAARAEHGLLPYAYNETLARAARLHGQDCLQRGWCGHTGSDGSNVKLRILRAGYDAAGWAECIVYSSSPHDAVNWWMDEVPPNDAHRRTLLSTWVTEIGISVVPTDRGYYYFIADFGRPRTP